ncbi:hypothetical protein [Deinococcus hohokamensis]|uniref:Uncharacterized protein n=1 Tax=Deinococcus hohokamensis TaxID=309883 RepID=A0ABV9IBU0_9DEIO
MGLDVLFTVEHRLPGGPWKRAEPLVTNTIDVEYFLDDDDNIRELATLQGRLVHEDWSFWPRDHWIIQVPWTVSRPRPDDLTQETREYFELWTHVEPGEDPGGMITLRDMEETDWEQKVGHFLWEDRSSDDDPRPYIVRIRERVLACLRALGHPDDVRLIYGFNY